MENETTDTIKTEELFLESCFNLDVIPFSPSRLKDERKKRGWKQSDLAEKSGLSQGAISQLEKGVINPGEKQLRALGAAFNVFFYADWKDDGWEKELKNQKAPE